VTKRERPHRLIDKIPSVEEFQQRINTLTFDGSIQTVDCAEHSVTLAWRQL
jgi:hypothetical protein